MDHKECLATAKLYCSIAQFDSRFSNDTVGHLSLEAIEAIFFYASWLRARPYVSLATVAPLVFRL